MYHLINFSYNSHGVLRAENVLRIKLSSFVLLMKNNKGNATISIAKIRKAMMCEVNKADEC